MMHLLSPAKLNLFFHVLKKREDGYHEIASLFHTVSLFDKVSICLTGEDLFRCSEKKLETSQNLILKALNAFRQKTNLNHPVAIELEKNIPIEAGLGGASSNAATVLWGLNELFEKPLPLIELKEIAQTIGADVPFFFSNGCALCTGIGEKMEKMKIPAFNTTIVKPNFGLSTPLVYQKCEPKWVDYRETVRKFLEGKPSYFNDLEKAAIKINPNFLEFKNKLSQTQKVCMTGSGSAFFCMGNVDSKISDCSYYPVQSVLREESSWY